VVGLPNDPAVIRLVGAVLADHTTSGQSPATTSRRPRWQSSTDRAILTQRPATAHSPSRDATRNHNNDSHHSAQCHVGEVSVRLMIVLLARSTTPCPSVARSRLAASNTMWTGRRGLIGAWHRPN
jgi:hypothetical protein